MYTAWRLSSELFLVLLLVGFGGVVVALLRIGIFWMAGYWLFCFEDSVFEAQADQG